MLQFLSEATSPDAFGLSAIGTERADGLEWLSIQFVQTHPGDRHEIVSLILRPVIRDGLLYIEASRFDKENDPSGNRAPEWEGKLKRSSSAPCAEGPAGLAMKRRTKSRASRRRAYPQRDRFARGRACSHVVACAVCAR